MANKNGDIRITIVSKGENNLGGDTTALTTNNAETSALPYNEENNATSKPQDIGSGVAATGKKLLGMAGTLALSMVITRGMYQVNKYLNLSENYLMENTVNAAEGIINFSIGFAGSVAAGAMAGGVIGAALTGSFYVLNHALKMGETQEQQRIALNSMNYNRDFAATRLGLIDDSKNTLN